MAQEASGGGLTMTEYIEREAAYREICSDETMSGYEKAYCSELIRNIPSADVALVVHGHWIIGGDNDDFDIKCSKCEWTDIFEVAGIAAVERIAKSMHYCPNCGAKMEEVSE